MTEFVKDNKTKSAAFLNVSTRLEKGNVAPCAGPVSTGKYLLICECAAWSLESLFRPVIEMPSPPAES